MNAPALALAWQLGGRHRRELAAALASWLLCAVLVALLPGDTFAREMVAMVGGVVLPVTLCHLLALFAYGFDGIPIEARESAFPARQYTLPVRTSVLVGCPMLYGTAAAALAWVAWAGLVFRPAGLDLPLAWPALLLAAVLAWLQAILWSPFGLPLVRLPVAVLVPTALLVLGSVGVTFGVSEPVLVALYGALLPPAYLVAWSGVARGRRGDVPDWTGWARAPRAVRAAPTTRPPFASPARAQLWYEWRLHGLTFPFLLLCLFLPLTGVAVLLARLGQEAVAGGVYPFLLRFTPETRLTILLVHPLLTLPPFVAALLGNGLGSVGPRFQVSSFLVTRPLGSGAVVTAKLRMAARSTLAAAALTLLTALGWLGLTGAWRDVAGWWGQVVEMYQPAGAWALLVVAAAGLLGLTWLQLCQGMILGLAGRVWGQLVPLLAICLLVALALLSGWLLHRPQYEPLLWEVLPWGLGVLALLKAVAAVRAGQAVLRRGFWGPHVVATVVGVWLLTAGCLLVLAVVLVPAGAVPWYVPTLGIVLALPLARILASPLVLEWSRHR